MIINGSVKLQKSSFTSLIVNGSAEVSEVTFTQKLTVNGSLKMMHSTLRDLTVSGSAVFEKCKVDGLVQAFGSVDFVDCDLANVELVSSSVGFHTCKINSLVMSKFSLSSKILHFFGYTQKIILQDTVVSADIIFVGGKGVVELRGSSQVKGNVIGGTIVQGS